MLLNQFPAAVLPMEHCGETDPMKAIAKIKWQRRNAGAHAQVSRSYAVTINQEVNM